MNLCQEEFSTRMDPHICGDIANYLYYVSSDKKIPRLPIILKPKKL